MGLAELAARVVAREVSARELVEEALRRIERLDPPLHAVVGLREQARAEAAARDEAAARRDEPAPLAGLPVLVKDVTDVAGMRTTFGSRLFADAPPAVADGLVPSRLRAAGAIVVGKTNTPEFATEGYSANLVFGATANPWNLDATPGGSSGGSAAALAAGMVPIATAADGGGSVRIPAAWCGLVGFKPTNGVIGRDPVPDWIDFSTDGPMTTSVADARLLLAVTAGPVNGDPTALPCPVSGVGPPLRRVYAIPRFADWGPLTAEVAEPFERALTRVEAAFGVAIEMLEPSDLFGVDNVDEDWFAIAGPEHAHRLGRSTIEERGEELHPATLGFLQEGLAVPFEAYLAARRRRFAYVRAMDELLGQDAVLCSPVMAAPACSPEGVAADADGPGLGVDAYCTQAQNMTGHPAISVPAGRSVDGVPFGLQLTGPRFRDHFVLDLAQAWEQAEPWPLVADGYAPFDMTGGDDGS